MVNACLLLAADRILRPRRRRLRRGIGAEALRIEAGGLLEHRRDLIAELRAGYPRMLMRRLIGEGGIPAVEPSIAVEMRDHRLLIGDDRIPVAQAELGVSCVLANRAGHH